MFNNILRGTRYSQGNICQLVHCDDGAAPSIVDQQLTMGVTMITNWGFLCSPRIRATLHQDPAQDPLNSGKSDSQVTRHQLV